MVYIESVMRLSFVISVVGLDLFRKNISDIIFCYPATETSEATWRGNVIIISVLADLLLI